MTATAPRVGAVGPLPWPEARRRAGAAAPLPSRTVGLGDAAGAVLAEPLRSVLDLPGADTAAMDGYAVAGPGPWRVRGRLLAGRLTQPVAALDDGVAVEIATGAPLPPGAEAVLPYEHSTVDRGLVAGRVEVGRHVRLAGEECRRGDEVLAAGQVLTPLALGLAAATGHDLVRVLPRPAVRVLITGDEVVRSGLPGRGEVRDAVGPLLPGLVAAAGGDVTDSCAVADRRGDLAAALQAGAADVVVTTGASAAGPADHLRPVLVELAASVVVDGVACRPGHPQLLARLPGGRYVVGLPGNPLAAVAGALTVLSPLLAALGGRPFPAPALGVAGERLLARPDDTRLVPVALRDGRAVLVGSSAPSMLRGAARAHALAVVPPGTAIAPGDDVELLPLPL